MKYSEFEERVKILGLFVEDGPNEKHVLNSTGEVIISISTVEPFVLDSNWTEFRNLTSEKKKALLDLSYFLASTPIEEREEEKRYRLRFVGHIDDGCCYLNISRKGVRTINTKYEDGGYKIIFTESELEHIDETGFIREEVTE